MVVKKEKKINESYKYSQYHDLKVTRGKYEISDTFSQKLRNKHIFVNISRNTQLFLMKTATHTKQKVHILII